MTSADPEGADAALGAARAAIGRLDPSRHPDDLAADLLDAWSAVERALRAAVGGSGTAGMQLVREARRRQLLTFDQANALAALSAARDRARDTAYRPDEGDLDAARRALEALEASLGAGTVGAATSMPPTGAVPPPASPPALPSLAGMTPPGMRHSPLGRLEPAPVPPLADAAQPSRAGRGRVVAGAIVLLLVLGGAYYWFGGPRRDVVLRRAMAEYEAGNLDSAAVDFRRALLIDPDYPLTHVYLARIARRSGHPDAANAELQLALTADPGNFLALREMGSYLFVAGQYELARKFYVRAVAANPEDPAAQGFLGCALVKLGRIDEGERWMTRAGPGVWTSCVSGATPPDTVAR